MILSCSNISKSFGENDVLKHISFHIEEHEKAAVVGINGAGKSTLLKIIIGELAPDSALSPWPRELPSATWPSTRTWMPPPPSTTPFWR